MKLHGYVITLPGSRIVVLPGEEFDWLLDQARLAGEYAPRPEDALPAPELPAWLDDHIDTEIIVL